MTPRSRVRRLAGAYCVAAALAPWVALALGFRDAWQALVLLAVLSGFCASLFAGRVSSWAADERRYMAWRIVLLGVSALVAIFLASFVPG
jgi:hypothetical protein